MSEKTDAELLADLGIEQVKKTVAARTPREARIINGFEEILEFVNVHGHVPRNNPDNDIFERLYAQRLDSLRKQSDCRELLSEIDTDGLLDSAETELPELENMDDAQLLATLGVEASNDTSSIESLKHVRSAAQKREAAEEIADRKACADFQKFRPLFDAVRDDIASGVRVTKPYEKVSGITQTRLIEQGQFYIVGGVMAYVAEMEELEVTKHGYKNARLRVVFDNGTESNPLFQTLHKSLRDDETGRMISEPDAGPLFGVSEVVEGTESGIIYVLRSLSKQSDIADRREITHKIGVTSGDVKKRVANARNDATYLLADVEVVAEFKLVNIDRKKLELLLHRFFAAARLDIEIKDRFNKSVKPREWYLVPLPAIKEAIDRISDRTLQNYRYDTATATLVRT